MGYDPADIDECAISADLCDVDTRCVNTLGSYMCEENSDSTSTVIGVIIAALVLIILMAAVTVVFVYRRQKMKVKQRRLIRQ